MNCFSDGGCWNLDDSGLCMNNNTRYYCKELNLYINPYKKFDCDKYTGIESCCTCHFSDQEIWKTGTVSCIAYKCKKMDNNVKFINEHPSLNKFSNHPPCPIDKWKKD